MKKPLPLVLSALCAATLTVTGCKTNASADYVHLNLSAYTLLGDPSTLTVTVDASGPYEVLPGASWLEITNETEDGFTLSAPENPDKGIRSTTVTVNSGTASARLLVDQLMKDNAYRYRRLSVHGAAISPGGRYIATNTDEIREGVEGSLLQLIDMRTGETATTYVPAYVSALSAVTDDGLVFGCIGSITAYMFDIRTGDYSIVPTPENTGTPMVDNVSADGTKWAGTCVRGMTYAPVLWSDGIPAFLPLPETDYRGGDITDRILARGISDDGQVVYGNTWVGFDMGMLYWKDGKVDWVGKDLRQLTTISNVDGTEQTLVNGMTCTAEPHNISETGKYISGTYKQEFNPETGQPEEMSCPAFYNTETETTILFEEFSGAGGYACRDDGLAVILPGSRLVNIETQEVYGTHQEYVLQHFGLILPAGNVEFITGEHHDIFFGMEPGILLPWWWYFAPKPEA